MGLLSLIAYLPLLGALVIVFLIDGRRADAIRWVANLVALVDLILSLLLLPGFDVGADGFQFIERFDWIPAIGVQYHFGIDGISLLLILLTTLLGSISILSSWTAITERVKEYYVFMLLLQTGMLGVFTALDFFLFYVFWEVMLVPMYFLIGVWGGPRKLYAAIKFFLYTLAGSVLMLLGILAVYFHYASVSGVYTFDLTRLLTLDYPAALQFWAFLAFFVGFAIKVPMFPFHTWLPDAHVEAPTAGSVILAGVLLKMGTYGFVRFSLPLFPRATLELLPWMVALSIIGILYGAMVAMMQKDWKKLVAYSSVSHLGFCMLGVFTLNAVGLKGGILQMINHGVSTGALFLIVGLIYERCHTRMIAEYSGLSHAMVVYATLFMIITMSSIGLPGLNGFIGEFMVLQGSFQVDWRWAAWAAPGIVLGAAYMLWLYQRVMFGKLATPHDTPVADLNLREAATLVPLVILCFWIGLYPKPFLAYFDRPVQFIVERIERARGSQVATAPTAAATAPAAAVRAD